ncbi:MAG: class B sortase [Lachnospiraceae bacterium]|nr:class B sortase [Lachnospiraceae bacterium]MDD3615306.1 class B sortase [Lachnospiraceae bacterium]
MSGKRKAFFWLLILIVAGCVGYLTYYFVGQKQNEDVYENLKAEVEEPEPEPEPAEEPEPAPAEEPVEEPVAETPVPVDIPIDFNTLWQTNPDIYAWIQIPDTNVDYPVAQSATDNVYYLNNTIEGAAGYPGSIYTENYNAKDFSDFDTVVYGHNMRNGSMFGTLQKYRDSSYMAAHPQIIVYTPDYKRTYQIFASVVYSDRHILNTFDFTQEAGRQEYLDSILNGNDMNNIVNRDVTVDINSRILTLSTCITGQPNNRYLVEAVLISEEAGQ